MYKLVLASKSPRRKQILRDNNFDFQFFSAEIDEESYENLPAEEMVKTLSKLKAEKVARNFTNSIIIAADTTVHLNNKILSKPRDLKHAKKMLMSLSGTNHEVITGFTIIEPDKKPKTYFETTKVYFKKLSNKEINEYVNNHEVLDKAGAYGIQDGADGFVEKYEGDYLNIVGLPTKAILKLKKILK